MQTYKHITTNKTSLTALHFSPSLLQSTLRYSASYPEWVGEW